MWLQNRWNLVKKQISITKIVLMRLRIISVLSLNTLQDKIVYHVLTGGLVELQVCMCSFSEQRGKTAA